MTYARSRLWLGISGVGLQVVLAGVSLWFDLPHRLLNGMASLGAIGLTLLCYVLFSIPSDLLGGYLLPRRHKRSSLSFASFFSAWVRGVLSQALVIGLSATALLEAARWGGTWAATACFALLMVVLLAAQAGVAQMVGDLSIVPQTAFEQARGREIGLPKTEASERAVPLIMRSRDPGFVGGIVGLPGREHVVLPSAWVSDLPPEVLAVVRTRRRGVLATGTRTRGLAVAILWNLVGFILASHLPGSSLADAPGLIQCGLWFTLWSFVGLLTLPSVNRPAVFEADRFAREQGISPEALSSAISCLDHLQDDEPVRTRWVERIFHPIPSVESRIAMERSGRSPRGAWQSARVTLYLSWACFGFLSRAVHCNAGRPELWVLFPGD